MNETTWQDGIRRYAHGVTYTTHDDVMISPAEVRALRETVQRLQQRQDEAVALLSALMLRVGRDEASRADVADTINAALEVLDG